MSETQIEYTDGEWHFIGVRETPEDECHYLISAPHGHTVAETPCRSGAALPEDTANARLIAAAPDLLEACEKLLVIAEVAHDHVGYHAVADDMAADIVQARDALAKAKPKGE